MSLAPLSTLDTARSTSQRDTSIATNSTDGAATSRASTTTTTTSNSDSSGLALRDEFLQMMVAQIQNQDPTNPLDATQYVTQLAQFSMVEGVENLKVLQLRSLAMMDTQQVLQSTTLVGKEVMVPVETITLDEDKALRGQIELPGDATDLTLTVYDEFGQAVQTKEWGETAAGIIDYELDELPPGKYTFEVKASSDSLAVQPKNYTASTVERVSLPGDGSIMLHVTGLSEDVSLYSAVEFGRAN